MPQPYQILGCEGVALLAEGVDRNNDATPNIIIGMVALLAEGVDRNVNPSVSLMAACCRPPRGGRG